MLVGKEVWWQCVPLIIHFSWRTRLTKQIEMNHSLQYLILVSSMRKNNPTDFQNVYRCAQNVGMAWIRRKNNISSSSFDDICYCSGWWQHLLTRWSVMFWKDLYYVGCLQKHGCLSFLNRSLPPTRRSSFSHWLSTSQTSSQKCDKQQPTALEWWHSLVALSLLTSVLVSFNSVALALLLCGLRLEIMFMTICGKELQSRQLQSLE